MCSQHDICRERIWRGVKRSVYIRSEAEYIWVILLEHFSPLYKLYSALGGPGDTFKTGVSIRVIKTKYAISCFSNWSVRCFKPLNILVSVGRPLHTTVFTVRSCESRRKRIIFSASWDRKVMKFREHALRAMLTFFCTWKLQLMLLSIVKPRSLAEFDAVRFHLNEEYNVV